MAKGLTSKTGRQGKILELVQERPVSSQEELSRFLEGQGINVTQSTLSRDIRELGLVKAQGLYQAPQAVHANARPDTLRRSFRQMAVDHAVSGNILMVKTAPGNAHSLGVVLDGIRWPEILGTVAGDDTIFILLRNSRVGRKVLRRIEDLLV